LNRFDNTGSITTDTEGLIIFAYTGDVDQITAEEWLTVPGQQFKEILISSPVDLNAIAFQTLVAQPIKISDNYPFTFDNDEQIDSILLTEGSLQIIVESTIMHTSVIHLSSSHIIKENGDSLNEAIQISDPSGNYFNVFNISLNGGKILLDNSDPDSSFMPLNFQLDVTQSPGVGLSSAEKVDIQLNIGQMRIEGAFGSVGTQDIQLIKDQELNLELFEGLFDGTVSFADPRLSMNVHSSFGLPIGFVFEDVSARMKDGTSTVLNIDEPYFLVDGPKRTNLDQTITSVIQMNKNNSNIEDLFTTDLRGLTYSVRLLTNPESTGLSDNFFLATSGIAVDYEFLLPMDLRVEDLVLQDTMSFELFNADEGREIDVEALSLNIETENWMPLEVSLQLYFADSNYVILDSLYTGGNTQLLTSGTLESGRVVAPSKNTSTIDLTMDQINRILDARHAFIQATIETANSGLTDVKFYSDYTLGFNLSTEVDVVLRTSSDN